MLYARNKFSLLFHRVCCSEFFTSSFCTTLFYSLVSITFHVLNASSGPSSNLADDAELSSSVSKLRFKVRNGSLIKGCCASLRDSDSHIPRCRVSALYSRPPISPSPPSPTAPCCQSFSLVVLIFLAIRFFSSTDISNTATDCAEQKIYMVYLVHYINNSR